MTLFTASICLMGKGWSPYDLLHVLGTASHPILFRAAPRIPARISEEGTVFVGDKKIASGSIVTREKAEEKHVRTVVRD